MGDCGILIGEGLETVARGYLPITWGKGYPWFSLGVAKSLGEIV